MTTAQARPDIRWEAHHGDRVTPCFAHRPANLNALFQESVTRWPHSEALVDGVRRYSFLDLDGAASAVAGALAARGVTAGDRVALLLANRAEFVITLLAILRLGAIAIPMNVREQTPELAHVLVDTGAKGLVHEADIASRLPPPAEVPGLSWRVEVDDTVGGGDFSSLLAGAPLRDAVEVDEEAAALLLYTSGTTGRPKGAVLSHLALVTTALHFQSVWGLQPGERGVTAVPVSHVTGMTALLLSLLRVGGACILMRAFRAETFLRLAAEERMTYTLMVPAMYNLCLLQGDLKSVDLSAWRIGGYGGGPMAPATLEAVARLLPVLELLNAYGATETAAPATLTPRSGAAATAGTVGRPLPCADIRVMDEHGREVPVGDPGEIWIGGAMVATGYWRNPAATKAAFVAGYWKSGDIGALDTNGCLRVFDRSKDMINRAGYKVYSVEVENVLSHHPGVGESAVVGEPDPVLGEKVRVFVFPKADDLTVESVRRWCAERLSDYKVPDFVTFVDQPLPRNANGKIMKRDLRRLT